MPGSLIIGSIVLAISTPLNPWIVGACAGALVLVALGADRLIRRGKRRDVDTNGPDRVAPRSEVD